MAEMPQLLQLFAAQTRTIDHGITPCAEACIRLHFTQHCVPGSHSYGPFLRRVFM